MIGCVSPKSGGTLRVLGMDPDRDGAKIRARLGVVPQADNLDAELTVRENLLIYARYFEVPRADAALARRSCWSSSSSPTAPTARSSRCRVA